MRSETSFFNKTLIRTDIRRYWPVLFAYVAVWMSLPLTQWTQAHFYQEQYFPGDTIYEMMPAALGIALVFGCIMAMAVFSYLTNSRAVGLMHSLPVRRTTHFVSHVSAALLMFTAGNVLVALLTLLVQAVTGSAAVMDVLVWVAVVTMLDVFFFSMALLCCMFTGWLLAVPVLYGALNCIVWVVQALLQSLGGLFYFGYVSASVSRGVMWCTPVMKLISAMDQYYYQTPNGVLTYGQYQEQFPMTNMPRCMGGELWKTLAIYTVVAIVLLAISWVLYRMRSSESAADPVAFGWAKPIFRYGIALLGGLAVGLGLYVILAVNSRQVQLPLLLVCFIAMGIIAYFAASMVIAKSFKVFRSGWKGAIAVSVVLVVVCLVTKMDPTGFARRIPAPEDVASVSLNVSYGNGSSGDCTDAETIAAALATHEAILTYGEPTNFDANWWGIYIHYTLKDGRSMYRTYNLDEQQIKTTPELKEALNHVLNTDEVRRTRVMGRAKPLSEQESLWGGYVEIYDERGIHEQLTAEQATAFYEALKRDFDNGAGRMEVGEPREMIADMSLSLTTNTQDIYFNGLPADATEAIAVLEDILGVTSLIDAA